MWQPTVLHTKPRWVQGKSWLQEWEAWPPGCRLLARSGSLSGQCVKHTCSPDLTVYLRISYENTGPHLGKQNVGSSLWRHPCAPTVALSWPVGHLPEQAACLLYQPVSRRHHQIRCNFSGAICLTDARPALPPLLWTIFSLTWAEGQTCLHCT